VIELSASAHTRSYCVDVGDVGGERVCEFEVISRNEEISTFFFKLPFKTLKNLAN